LKSTNLKRENWSIDMKYGQEIQHRKDKKEEEVEDTYSLQGESLECGK
jgi:hypothetical protein